MTRLSHQQRPSSTQPRQRPTGRDTQDESPAGIRISAPVELSRLTPVSEETRSRAVADAEVDQAESVARCWLAQHADTPCDFYPRGYPDPAHLVRAQRVKREGLDPRDARIIVPACRAHHHALDFAKTIRLSLEDYPASVHEWATEHGFAFRDERTGWVAVA